MMMSLLLASRIGQVASILAELLCIDRECRSYDLDRICHINTLLLIVN